MKKNKPVSSPRAAAPPPSPALRAASFPEKSPKIAVSSGVHWKEWLIFWALAVVCFGIVRSLFPAPGYVTDTRGYLMGAMEGATIGYRPMGISSFYAGVYEIAPGAVAGVWAQFLLHLAGTTILLYGISRCGQMKPLFRRILWATTFLNPALLYLANFLLADSVFISLTFAWAGALLCSLRRANWPWGLAAVGFFYASLYIRYNGLVYPFIAAIVLLLLVGRRQPLFRFSFLGVYIAAAALFYYKVTSEMELRTNETVLSGFSGWQTASNAMKAIKYDLSATQPLETSDPQLRQIDERARQYIDSFVKADPAYRKTFATDFMWMGNAPFKQFEAARRLQYPMQDAFVNWVQTSLVLQEYGKAVIRQNTGAYFAHYLIPNVGEFFVPDLEILAQPQSPENTLWPALREWYRMPANPLSADPRTQVVLSEISRVLYSAFSILFIVFVPLVLLTRRKALALLPDFRKLLLFCLVTWLCIAGFDVIAAPQALRYVVLLTPFVMTGVFIAVQLLLSKEKTVTPASSGPDIG